MEFFAKEKGTIDTIKCLACRHYCIIPKNGFGLCGARKNVNGKILLVTYSKPCSLNLDPIEKKPLYHFLPSSKTMSIGFFGCNFRCDFCQNYEISSMKGTKAEDALKNAEIISPKLFTSVAKERSAQSIAVTYNEPAISVEYNLEAFELAHKNSLKTVYVSNGYVTEEQARELKKPKTKLDAINIDLKSFDENFYKKVCGGELEKVLDCIKSFSKAKIWMEITTLIIPGKNNSPEELKKIAGFISELDRNIPWHISAFFPMYKMTNISPTGRDDISLAVNIGKEAGLNFVYAGNLPGTNDTHCPKCGKTLIKRNGFDTSIVGLEKNKCNNCGEKIPGIFK
jgi:pyruvate formate lyase activating enzyme